MDTRIAATRIEHDYTLTGPEKDILVEAIKLAADLSAEGGLLDITDVMISIEQRCERLEDEILDIRCCSPHSVDAMSALDAKITSLRKTAKLLESRKPNTKALRKLARMFEHSFETIIKDVG